MLSVISEPVINTARLLNERDQQLAQEGSNKENFKPDEDFWANTKGVEGLKGKSGQPKRAGGSYYSLGPYPRNRRILADVALSTGWDVYKTRELEARCVIAAAKQYASVEKEAAVGGKPWDLTDLENPTKNGEPFTFQHIAWCRLPHLILRGVEDMDPDQRAAVKAGVLDVYKGNSKTGYKVLPAISKKRKSSDGPDLDEVEQAQAELNKEDRYSQGVMSQIRPHYRAPEVVKRQAKAYMVAEKMSSQDFCEKISITEHEYQSFLDCKKKKDQYESRAYHEIKAFLNEVDGIENEPAVPWVKTLGSYKRDENETKRAAKRVMRAR